MPEFNRMSAHTATMAWIHVMSNESPMELQRIIGGNVIDEAAQFLLIEKKLPLTITTVDAATWASAYIIARFDREYREVFRQFGVEVNVNTMIPDTDPGKFEIVFTSGDKLARYIWADDVVLLLDKKSRESILKTEKVDPTYPVFRTILRYLKD